MEHRKTTVLEAKATTTTDQGAFSAIAAAYTVDRVKDQIVYGAFQDTIAAWKSSGKQVPLHWNHMGDASNIIGSIDPQSMVEQKDIGLYVEGQLDLGDSATAKEAWRSMKAGRMSLSFGYVVTKARMRKDSVQELQALDLFEISIVPNPANADTRVLSLKSTDRFCESCGQPVGLKASDPEPAMPALSDGSTQHSGTLAAPAATGTPVVKPTDDGYWDDLRRESYRLAASVLIDE